MTDVRVEYATLIGMTSELFCVEEPSRYGKSVYLAHFFSSRKAYAVCGFSGSDAIRVRLTVIEETNEALYYGWYSAEDNLLSMVFHARMLVEICFPYGSRAEEDRGRGRVVALRVERLEGDT